MGIVYICLDHQDNCPVALKTFKPEYLPNRAVRDRFLREGTAWVDLGVHPHIVHCYRVERIGDGREVYLVLELIAKEQGYPAASLRSWLGQPLPVATSLIFALQIARGMQHAASRLPGFVHRDLKPENILVGADKLPAIGVNRLRVTDFGLAAVLETIGDRRLVTDDESTTQPLNHQPTNPLNHNSQPTTFLTRTQLTHGIVGTPLYMAPEQWLGEPVGVYTDVYALGCMMVEMLTGQRAVAGESLTALQRAHCAGEARPVPPDLPEAVRACVTRCVALEPGTRYATWDAVTEALVRTYGGATGQSAPVALPLADLSRVERVAHGWSYSAMGVSYLDLGKAQVAAGYFTRAREIGAATEERGLEGAALSNLGNAYADLGEVQRAIGCHDQALVILREIGDRREEGNSLTNLGTACADLGEFQRAIGYYEQALVISREIGNRLGEGYTLDNLGIAYKNLGEVRRAIGYYEQALVVLREIKDRHGEGAVLGNLGVAYDELGEVRRAIDYHEQALVIAREIGDRRGEGHDLGNLGVAYDKLGEVRRAIGYYEQALVVLREIKDRHGEGAILGNLGGACADLGEFQRAIGYHEQALVISREIGNLMSAAISSFNIALLHAKQGAATQALPLAREAARIFAQIGSPHAQQAQQLVAKLQRGGVATNQPDADPTQQAFKAFLEARSLEEMWRVTSQFPFIIEPGFIAAVEQIIAQQVPPQLQPVFQQRLAWLRQIANS
jgi:tetratricopeptide (TPR) repeat protein